MWTSLRDQAAGRCRSVCADRGDLPDLQVQVLRQWYRRCYLDAVNDAMRVSTPLRRVSAAEVQAVIVSLRLGEVRRIIGRDGIPLMTSQNTRTTDLDRRLDAGEVGVVPPPGSPRKSPELRMRAETRWATADAGDRAELA